MNMPAPLLDVIVPAGEPWTGIVRRGQMFRIVDLEGNQAVDTLFYNAADTAEHYSAADTITAQRQLYLTTGSQLRSNLGRTLMTIVEDTCGRHDTLGGACSAGATPCATRTRSATCTAAATISCRRCSNGNSGSANATCPPTSTSS
jgi:uncharacterized protein YcgI (DUF1989 family)